MNNFQLEKIINKKLNNHLFHDVIPNGLQIEGTKYIKKIITGVSICQKLINIAIKKNAQAIIVHHGFFWKNECSKIIKNKKKRLKSILENNINIYNWHLPLDIHKTLGNNIQIANQLNINVLGKISDLILWGKFNSPISVLNLFNKIHNKFKRKPLCFQHNKNNIINNIAWCSGKGQDFIKNIHEFNIDAFLTGEVSEDTLHYAYENKIHFFSAGHYATERYGIQALGIWLMKKYNLDIEFIELYNPV
ncbi:Nif3-like dinuclear metal center hexameric protein [Buchnera aphidicola]|uniref:GTP cyclohydrolase 1 type 2 homolog n=1 Tax=Buchnera aphidicola (Therioaphis trifolii) TaxID=1241884 RepID=A0A4D6YDR1_9GAMM|nr:Nif3-like dinuclear metal center hexameric protein [Buchnera aphidicola]QCI27202.1 Nif3-like dinuclear metal center hexameric protein [Buchnera aphidicola (Therioaphis trifolii)]